MRVHAYIAHVAAQVAFSALVTAKITVHGDAVHGDTVTVPGPAFFLLLAFASNIGVWSLVQLTLSFLTARLGRTTLPGEPGTEAGPYRSQAIVDRGNVQAMGDVRSTVSGGEVVIRLGRWRVRGRSLSNVNLSASDDTLTLKVGGTKLSVEAD